MGLPLPNSQEQLELGIVSKACGSRVSSPTKRLSNEERKRTPHQLGAKLPRKKTKKKDKGKRDESVMRKKATFSRMSSTQKPGAEHSNKKKNL